MASTPENSMLLERFTNSLTSQLLKEYPDIDSVPASDQLIVSLPFNPKGDIQANTYHTTFHTDFERDFDRTNIAQIHRTLLNEPGFKPVLSIIKKASGEVFFNNPLEYLCLLAPATAPSVTQFFPDFTTAGATEIDPDSYAIYDVVNKKTYQQPPFNTFIDFVITQTLNT